ncbi:MAG: helix-turn-helix domain-containing protein [Albidovulum sp.]|nr:helix-turn-helix domain-containing protein [Albidovulum sp.]
MSARGRNEFSERLPDQLEVTNAKQLREIVASQVRDINEPTKLSLAVNNDDVQTVTLLPALTKSLLEVLRLISSGHGFYMIPVEARLTTQQAADLLNVSRPFLVKLLEKEEIPFTTTGRHRRIRANDIFAYKEKRDAERSQALKALARLDADEFLA